MMEYSLPTLYKTRSDRTRVALVWTGGTIASGQGKDGVEPQLTAHEFLDEHIPQHIKAGFKIDASVPDGLSPTGIDSTENSSDVMEAIRCKIHELLCQDYAGVIVAHGTDTLAHSAQYTAFTLQNLHAPVIFTGSQYPPSHPRSDALLNFSDALAVCESSIGEVVIAFGQKILRAVAAHKQHGRATEAFHTPHQKGPIAQFEQGLQVSPTARFRSPPFTQVETYPGFEPVDCPVIRLDAFTSGQTIQKMLDTHDGLIIEGFGEGNIPITRDRIQDRIKQAIDKGKYIIVTPQCSSGESPTKYKVSASNDSMIVAAGMVSSCAHMKLGWLLHQAKLLGKNARDYVRQGFRVNYVGEFPENGQHYPLRTKQQAQ